MADALERAASLVSVNGCGQYAAVRAGGIRALRLGGTELGVWAARFLERSASTLTALDLRCARCLSRGQGCIGAFNGSIYRYIYRCASGFYFFAGTLTCGRHRSAAVHPNATLKLSRDHHQTNFQLSPLLPHCPS